ncbi:surface anchored protein [Corynebacterium amycolatum]|uniref:surface anchored protein n=1 Tax=Corynebacterium amycolatum TaxID=43765 RepID=UPI00254DB005|nr:surface anchored protein [Corynebacterium amycolatum]MDK7199115.1 surface anchored protein [Corynebacterium amycolatum]
MIKNRDNRLNSVVAGTIALAFTCAGLGAGADIAQAVPVAGRDGVAGVEQSVGTNVLKIRLTKGNPDDDGQTVAGSVEGVTIHLDRLEGIDPKNPADMKRVESARLDEIQKWNKDLNLSKVTDANGEVQFSGLVDGIYLVTSSAPDGNYREINAFLVAVPFHTVTEDPNPVEGVIVAKSHTPGKTPPPTTPPKTPPTTPTTPPKTPPTTPTDTPPTTPEDGRTTPATTPTTAPTKPPKTPVGESASGSSQGQSSSSGTSGSLALTGVQVAGLVAAAAALIGAGFIIIAVSRKKDKGSEGR